MGYLLVWPTPVINHISAATLLPMQGLMKGEAKFAGGSFHKRKESSLDLFVFLAAVAEILALRWYFVRNFQHHESSRSNNEKTIFPSFFENRSRFC